MKYPDRKIANFIESGDPDTRAQGVELARILVDEWTPNHERFAGLVIKHGVVAWADQERLYVQDGASRLQLLLVEAYPAGVFGYGHIEAIRCVEQLRLAWLSRNQRRFLNRLDDACVEAPRDHKAVVLAYERYCEATFQGTTRRNRALRLARALLAGGAQ